MEKYSSLQVGAKYTMFGMLDKNGISNIPRCVTSFMPYTEPANVSIVTGLLFIHTSCDSWS